MPTSSPSSPVTLKITFRCQSLEQFIERYHLDISRSGICIRAKSPLPVTTLLRFEFWLQGGSPLLSGSGTVSWVQGPDSAGQSGMGIHFNALTPECQPRLQQILAGQRRLVPPGFVSRFEQGLMTTLFPPLFQPVEEEVVFGDEPCRVTSLSDLQKEVAAIVASLSEAKQKAKKPT